MEKFEIQGKNYWENFGKSRDLAARHYFDFVNIEEYRKILDSRDLEGKKVIDIGSGYPAPKQNSYEKQLSPLASEVHEVLEGKGAEIIAVDVASDPLEHQKKEGRDSVSANAFHLPFKDDSIDGGCLVSNLFSSSFKSDDDREVFIKKDEVEKILNEVKRVLREGAFLIVNNYGYISVKMDMFKVIGPEKSEIISSDEIKNMEEEIGFRNIKEISLDGKKSEMGLNLIEQSFPEALRKQLKSSIEGSTALIAEK